MPKVVSLKLRELRKRGYDNVAEWLADPNHLYIGRKMNISIYTQHKSAEAPGTYVDANQNGEKILIRPHTRRRMRNQAFDEKLLSYPIGSYVDDHGKVVHLCAIPQSKWHNPFKVQKQKPKQSAFNARAPDPRRQCVNNFEQYLLSNQALMSSLHELEKYTEIGCWCKPLACHGDTILREFHKFKVQQRQKQQPQNQNGWRIKSTATQPNMNNNYNNNDNHNEHHNHSTDDNKNEAIRSECKVSLSMEAKTNISVCSALCIIPPLSVWTEIQNIRKLHDPGYQRWMPHINLIFPFIDERHFAEISAHISSKIVKQHQMKAFNVTLNSFDVFDRVKKENHTQQHNHNAWNQQGNGANPNKKETLFLKPYGCNQELQDLFNALKPDWMKCIAKAARGRNNQYVPHLTVGKFKMKEIVKYKHSFQSSWKPITFKCDAIYLISRRGNECFRIRHKISLC